MPLAIGIGISPVLGGGPSYAADTVSLIARMVARGAVAPSAGHKAAIDKFIKATVTSRSKLGFLRWHRAQDATAALTNWIADQNHAAVIGAPTFTAFVGYAPNGSTTGIDSNWNPSTSGVVTQNSMTLGGWLSAGDETASDNRAFMGNLNAFVDPRSATDTLRGRMNTTTTSNMGSSGAASRLGFTALSRTASNLTTGYRNGASVGTSTTASSGISNLNVFEGGYNNSGSLAGAVNNTMELTFGGGGMTDADILELYTAAAQYRTDLDTLFF